MSVKKQIEPEERHAQQAADQRAEKPVSAVLVGIVYILTHAEHRADAGKGRVPIDDGIQKSAQRR